MDKCPSIIILGQTISDLLRHSFGEVHMCYSKCASTKNISRVDFLSTSNLISSLCVCERNMRWCSLSAKCLTQTFRVGQIVKVV